MKGFVQYGYLGDNMDPLMKTVFDHEKREHRMPMTTEEVDEACYPQANIWGCGAHAGHTIG